MPSSQFPKNKLLPTCILISLMPSYNNTIKHSSTIKRQENPKLNATSLNPSPRRESLAQASPLRLGESSRIWNRALRTFSLRWNLPRLGETLACSKLSEPPGRPFARGGLGEPLLTSPRRDELAWASLTVAATAMPITVVFCTCQEQHQPSHAFTKTYQFKDLKNIS